jgi:hypothetical protein
MKSIQKKLETLAPIMGWSTEPWLDNKRMRVGAVVIDNQPIYGGYCLRMITNEQGGQTNIGRGLRMSPKEFDAWLDGVAWAMGYAASKHQEDVLTNLPRSHATGEYYAGEHQAKYPAR